jgi:tetratricopeptide (TPR) repeat protein
MRQAAALFPKKALFRANLALYASFGSDFQTAQREAQAAQELDPSYPTAFMALVFGQLGQGLLRQATETYQRLEKINNLGASYASSGLADRALYEGRFTDAVRMLEQGAMQDSAAKYPDRAALKLVTLAYTRLLQGQKTQAVAAAESALANSKTVKIRFLTGRIFASAGQTARAQELATSLASEVQSEPQVYAKLIEGEVALANGDPRGAINAFTQANNQVDTWIGRFDRGRAYLEIGAFAEADSDFDRCIKRRGEVLSLFVDPWPTYGYFPPVYYYLGRVREGLRSARSTESYRIYLSIRGKADEDPLLGEVRKRAGL